MTSLNTGSGRLFRSGPRCRGGRKTFQKRLQCHHIGLGATNFHGPVLNGLIGRKAGSVQGYKYSQALETSTIVWTDETLSKYLKEPKHAVPGVAMTFAGLKDQADIDNVIAYVSPFRRDGGKDRQRKGAAPRPPPILIFR